MKKHILYIRVIVIISILIRGTVNTFSQSLGVKFGLSYNYVQPKTIYFGDGVKDYPLNFPKSGFLVGLSTEIPMNETFTLKPEILFVKKTYAYHTDYNDNYTQNIYDLNYLEFPIGIKYLKQIGKAKLYALAGPVFSVGLRARKGIYGYKEVYPYGPEIENKNGFDGSFMPSADLGFNAGLGIEFKKFKYELKYQQGGFCCGGPDKFKLRMLSVSLEYILWKKKNEVE